MKPATEAKRRITKRQRIAQALELRKEGTTFSQIGRSLGLSKVRAFQLCAEALAELNSICAEKAEELRQLELERCDALQFKLWPQADNPRVADSILRVMERRAKLLGLDAPQKIAETDANGNDLAARARAIRARLLRPIETGATSTEGEERGGGMSGTDPIQAAITASTAASQRNSAQG